MSLDVNGTFDEPMERQTEIFSRFAAKFPRMALRMNEQARLSADMNRKISDLFMITSAKSDSRLRNSPTEVMGVKL